MESKSIDVRTQYTPIKLSPCLGEVIIKKYDPIIAFAHKC